MIIVQAADTGFASTRLCVPTSTSAAPLSWRVEVEVAGKGTVALTEQLRVVDVDVFGRPWEACPRTTYETSWPGYATCCRWCSRT